MMTPEWYYYYDRLQKKVKALSERVDKLEDENKALREKLEEQTNDSSGPRIAP